MAIYLCRVCGHTMGRSLGRCILCRGKSIDYYANEKSPEFIKLRNSLTGQREPWNERKSAFLVLALTSASLAVGLAIMESTKSSTADKSASRPALADVSKPVQ